MSLIAGAKRKFVPLRPKKSLSDSTSSCSSSSTWIWDENELEAAFTAKTKAIVLNTPNNPLGKVYTRQEIEKLASLCIEKNILCIADEVYEHLIYDPDRPHIRIGF